MDDSLIVDMFLARDEDALKHTSRKYGAKLRGIAFSIVRERTAAEEAENDTYMRAWESIPPHTPRKYLFAFLARITRNLSLNICRYNQALKRGAYVIELSEEMEECLPSPDSAECRLDNAVLGEVISDFLRKQSAEKRGIFLRRYWYFDTVSEIAERYLISESKVKSVLFRMREALKKHLESNGYIV